MKILIACPIKDRSWAVPHWYQGIEANFDINVNIQVLALVTPGEDKTEDMLAAYNIEVIQDLEPGRTVHDINTHVWGPLPKFEYMASLRNRLVDEALARDVDYFFSLDSDIVLPTMGLARLLDYARTHPGVVSPSVNMVPNGVAWNVMNWGNPHYPMAANRDKLYPHLMAQQAGRADVVMAAMLLDRSALACRWACHMAGEDIGFCLHAEELGIPRWWYPEVRCQHLMRPC